MHWSLELDVLQPCGLELNQPMQLGAKRTAAKPLQLNALQLNAAKRTAANVAWSLVAWSQR